MSNLLTKTETARWLHEHDGYLIATHRKPDGDTLGSAAALCRALRAIGKRADLLENPQVTPKYQPFVEGLCRAQEPDDTLICVDVASPGLFPLSLEKTARAALVIDHHASNSRYGENSWIEPGCAACGEMIFALCMALNAPLDVPTATALYLAVSTDTGCFRFSNVTANTLFVAAELLRHGVDAYRINKPFFSTKRLPRLKLEAALVQSMRQSAGGAICVCELPLALREQLGVIEDDLDDLSDFPRRIEGVEIGVVLREQEDGQCKVSVRSSPKYDSCAICRRIGGGGHPSASGATVPGTIDRARELVLGAIAAEYPEL